MAGFNYEAKKGPKEIIKGTIEADNQEAALDKINRMGYVPISIIPAKKNFSEKSLDIKNRGKEDNHEALPGNVRSKDLTIFIEQLASLIKSKVPILEAIGILHEQIENPALKKITLYIQSEIRDGKTLSQSLSKYPKVFPVLYVNMIESGETGGVLEATLMRLSDFRNKEEETRAKIASALAYPIFIIIIGIATIFALFIFVVPRMVSLFSEMGQTMPLPTRMLLALSSLIRNYWYWVIAVIAAIVSIVKRSGKRKNEKIIFDRLKLKLPLIGDFMKKSLIAGFARTFALLLANGIPILQAIKITMPTLNNEVFRLELEAVHKNIIDGMSLEQSMKRSQWFPSFMTNMLAVGERGGNLEESLLDVAGFYEREVDKMTKIITSLLEPAIILVTGLIVGFIVFAMLLPIFQLNIGVN
jgi:type II secretory pathway component PulF